MTFSIAVMSGNKRMFWNVRAIPRFVIWKRFRPARDCPSNMTDPLVAVYTPVITLKHVVFPAPFGPINPRISPLSMWKLTSSRATTPPKRIVTWSSSSSFSAICGLPLFQPALSSHAARQKALWTEHHHKNKHNTEHEVATG